MKYALVTGAYGGMGRAVALRLRQSGYCVFAMDRLTYEAEDNIFPITADITDEASLIAALEKVQAITDRLDAIIHLAGIYVLDSLLEIDDNAFLQVFNVNVFGAARVNRVFLPLLSAGSRILLTTSELAPLDPLPFTGLYAITKSTLDRYAYSLRMELQLKGIHVIVLRPGAVQTGMLNVSKEALGQFCDKTRLYSCNARRFKKIVDRIEAKNVPPECIADKISRILEKRAPRLVYSVNRNFLLILLNLLPRRLQTWIIRRILS